MQVRKHYLDNIRWLCILLLIPFHAAMAWNGWEDNYIWFYENKVLSSFVIFISPYFMPLLFVIAGMSTKYALNKRTNKQYIIERVNKLFIPLVAAIVTVVPVMSFFADKYHNQYKGNFIQHYKVFFTNMSDFTGYDGYFTPGHLWFLLYLFIISLLGLGIITVQKRKFSKLTFKNIPYYVLPLLLIFPLIMNRILNFGGKSIGEDFALFLLGYYVLSEENVMEIMSRFRWFYLAVTVVCDVIMTYLFVWEGHRSEIILTALQIVSLWFGVLGIIGLAKGAFNINNRFTRYMSRNSFLIYIFHFLWLVLIQYMISKIELNIVIAYLVSIFGTLILTILTCEIIRRPQL